LSITETVLIYGVIPLAVVGLCYAFVYGGSAGRAKRYRPGRPFVTAPVWFLANNAGTAADNGHEPTGTHHAALMPAGDLEVVHYGETGGASDSW
jgi:hypothetical protein